MPNADATLKPGLFATAAIEQPGNARALCVPSAAVRTLAGSTRLYVIKGDRVEERMVTLGQAVGDGIEIVNGIAEGDEVAQTGVDRLVDGARVRVGRPATTAAVATTVAEPVSGKGPARRAPATGSR